MSERWFRGKLSMVVEVGTIIGPNSYGELLVAGENDDSSTNFYVATKEDISSAKKRDPQSVTEFSWRQYVPG